jgi:hypothetical protein
VSETKFIFFHTTNKTIYIDFNENNDNVDLSKIVTLERVHNGGNSENQTYKLLGVLFDEFLSFNQNTLYVKNKLAKSIFLLNRWKKLSH